MREEHRLGSVARRLAATQRVLVVEDERDIADFLRAYFRASGYDIVHLDPDTPLAVLEAVDANDPDCLLLDLGLRGFSGEEAYRLLRSDLRYALLPVIVVSARHDARDVVARGGIDAVVAKPFDVQALAELVSERIERAARLREEAAADDTTGLLGHDYVEARLLDELTIAAPKQPAAFALVRLRGRSEIAALVGSEGLLYVVRELVRRARELLPDDVALGLTRHDELAVLLPACDADRAATALRAAIDGIGEVSLPGGAVVPLRFAAGVAAYPEHASDADGLYMAADAALTDAVDGDHILVVAI
jgi:PleD family two-component response regulator